MHFDRALWRFTAGVRLRVAWATLIGLLAVGLGMARLMLLAWLIAEVFAGRNLAGVGGSLPDAALLVAAVFCGALAWWTIICEVSRGK